ncbi:heavy metal-associated isoprenylated plant protein 31-like [Hibiscus syriacus]|uniref:heavy metal-associated isoprenylated plant protein 31-like n=1 Tax=Hibiscus syriacus TaxID=106335 RepID=UPI0019220C30|nr:heavy metal-associated isoprenylated plant protein 31-like [Hibiscus syriacus]
MSLMVQVRVPNLDCEGRASKLKKALSKLKGVEEVEVEMEIQKVTVRGYALEEKKVLKAVKREEAWPFPGYSHYASFYKYPSYIVNHYYDYYKSEGSINGVHTFFHTPALYSVAVASDEAVASLFNDDNPHAYSII